MLALSMLRNYPSLLVNLIGSPGRMRTLLRKVSTGLYFQGPDQWTMDPAHAHNFKVIDRALEFIERWKLQDVELAFAFNDLGFVKRAPVEKLASRYASR